MFYSFCANYREEFFGMVLYDKWGRLSYVDKETRYLVKALAQSPKSLRWLQNAFVFLSPKKIEEFLLWGIVKGYIDIVHNATIDIGQDAMVALDGFSNEKVNYDKRLSRPITATIYPEQSCNQKCFFCFAHDNMTNHKKHLSDLEWQRIIATCIREKVTRLVILGGEPLLKPSLLLSIIRQACREIPVTLFTNGTAMGGISTDLAKELAQYPNLDIVFSIHSNDENIHDEIVGLKGAYRIAVQSLRNVSATQGNLISVNSVVLTKNIDTLFPFAKELNAIGIKNFTFSPFTPWGDNAAFQDYMIKPESLLRQFKMISSYLSDAGSNMDITCDIPYATGAQIPQIEYSGEVKDMLIRPCMGDANMIIDFNGDVYACNSVVGDLTYKITNLLQNQRIEDFWGNYKWPHSRLGDWNKDRVCKDCKERTICYGGCPLISEKIFGERGKGNPYCYKVSQDNRNRGDEL